MKLYIWERVEHVTSNYHDEGGLMVIAEDLGEARALVSEECGKDCGAMTAEPDRVVTVAGEALKGVTTFPDSGCC